MKVYLVCEQYFAQDEYDGVYRSTEPSGVCLEDVRVFQSPSAARKEQHLSARRIIENSLLHRDHWWGSIEDVTTPSFGEGQPPYLVSALSRLNATEGVDLAKRAQVLDKLVELLEDKETRNRALDAVTAELQDFLVEVVEAELSESDE